ncbi:SDR family NAD(P)-dependent oxidoreductase [Embleya sp. NPDC008237]|uniref:SDR family NAD(P)-dependent oxidoreductase n=1 Tax=Embleya sp. NPDC008237 TaxID=3363978 RepID=UPI0036E89C1F
MTSQSPRRDQILAVSPLGRPNARIVIAAHRAGALGVLDLGRERDPALDALAEASAVPCFGVRVPVGCPLDPHELPEGVDVVLLAPDAPWSLADVGPGRRVLVEVTCAEAAHAAVAAGAAGVVARGAESGGRCGELTTFVLLQQLLADDRVSVPVWAAGGIGPHTAAAAVAGGAAGVLLDTQLALVAESTLPADVAAAVRAMDGSETVVIRGHRVYRRPDLPIARLAEQAADLGAALGTGGLHRELLPVGQDGASAARLADRHGTAGRVLRAVREAIVDHVASAARHGVGPRPVQGPMTRVSDRAAFAQAVAREGGLPFLALSLLRGPQVGALLTETAALLDDLPWGVGLLGFAPPELREEQLAAVLAARPPYALIAGGRPDRAAPLEAAGIRTYLHVPSPGLLTQFLREGARRFVFEGTECGGHVGPRASFPLWEAQLHELLSFAERHGGAAELDLLFAGGIHDARSAAMVAAAAAPLVERGASIGVLMGTAYLFTREAVDSGAIVPGFQAAAVECASTALVQTAPGHATRCAGTPFVAAFEAARRDLEARGVPSRQVWAELEQLNLGRLRIAGKGLRREAGALVAVDADTQRRDGMFMLGQAAVLRSAPTDVATLHREVTTGSAAWLARRVRELGGPTRPAAPRPQDVAIVGMACVLPGAPDLASYWRNILAGADAVTEVPRERWDVERYFAAGAESGSTVRGTVRGAAPGAVPPGRTPSKWGGFVPAIGFDATGYGIPPASLAAIEPAQLLALHVASGALADAGYGPGRAFARERTSVIFGAEAGADLAGAYGFRALFPGYYGALPADLDGQLPSPTEDSFPGVLANVIAGRIANRLDLGGVNYTVDAACAASLAALDLACKELNTGSSDLVLCGGVDTHNGINDFLMFSSVRALSPTGRCATFDADADGIALGEGAVCVLLKRLADAERDGDRVYAVVKGVGGSSDGRSLGLTAPRPEGQRRALERAYRAAGVSPARVGLVEAHGTGTVVGDRAELDALTEVFTEHGATPGGCAVGSVKSQIGHTKCAAGLAGLAKAALAVHFGVRPPTLHLRRPPDSGPFVFDGRARPWTAPVTERIAGVSAFGFGGTNFHAVLAGSELTGSGGPGGADAAWPAELFCFRGADRAAARAALDRLAARLDTDEDLPLRGLAALADEDSGGGGTGGGTGAGAGVEVPVQVAFVATDHADLRVKLTLARAGAVDPAGEIFHREETGTGSGTGSHGASDAGSNGVADTIWAAGSSAAMGAESDTGSGAVAGTAMVAEAGADADAVGQVAFLYPGQGSQRPGMLADLFARFPELCDGLRDIDPECVGAMFPPAAFGAEARAEQSARITDTRRAQPALGVAAVALTRLLDRFGVWPDQVAGHSYGEVAALWSAGVLSTRDLGRLGEVRAAAVLAAAGAEPGAMAAVSADADRVAEVLAGVDGVVLANRNTPTQTVVSGPEADLTTAIAALEGAGLSARRLPVACAFHSPVVAAAADTLTAAVAGLDVRTPRIPVWSNCTAARYPDAPAEVRALIARQVAEPVRFAEQIEAMYAAGVRIFVEAGPGRALTGMVRTILGDRPHTAVACDVPGEDGLRRLLTALAELAVAGVPVRVAGGLAGRVRPVDVEPGPRPAWTVDGHLVRTADGRPVPGGLLPATPVAPLPAEPAAGPGVSAGSARDAVLLEYLAGARAAVAAQREVLLGYLGVPGGVPEAPPAAAGPVPATLPRPEPEPVAVVAPAEEPGGPLTREHVLAVVLDIVGTRTGYPRDMLDPALDLEADLSVDSIKRTEIIGELALRLRLPGAVAGTGTGTGGAPGPADEAVIERLAKVKTIDAIVAGVLAVDAGADPRAGSLPASGSGPGEWASPVPPTEPAEPVGAGREEPAPPGADRPTRHLVECVPIEDPPPTSEAGPPIGDALRGRRVVLVEDGGGIAWALADLLAAHGVVVESRARDRAGPADDDRPDPAWSEVDTLVHLAALADGPDPILPDAFALLRAALVGGVRQVFLGTAGGGHFGRARAAAGPDPVPGAGLAGFARSAALEYPDRVLRVLDLDPKEEPARIARRLLAELGRTPGRPEPGDPVLLGLSGDRRLTLRTRPAPLPDLSPADRDELLRERLGPDSVVLLTGGARGITARTAVGLARATGCHVEVLGRTGDDGAPEPAALADAADAPALRAALIATGVREPARIEAELTRVLNRRQVRATLAELGEHAASVRLHVADVTDADAVRRILTGIAERHGRLDGIVHGAGVLADRLLVDKTAESCRQVFATKVAGARALVTALRTLRPTLAPPAFLAMFGSVAGVYGNRGQTDYAAANDALATLARHWSAESEDTLAPVAERVVTIDWGPWAATGGGMVTPELAREYARRGVPLIDPEHGVRALLTELASGRGPQAVYVCLPAPGSVSG